MPTSVFRCAFRDFALNASDAAQLLLVIAVDHRQRERAIALQLNGNIAGELQRGGQQAGGDQQLRQNGFHRLRVAMVGGICSNVSDTVTSSPRTA